MYRVAELLYSLPMHRLRIAALQMSLRAAIAAGLAYWIALLLGAHYAIYALIAAVIVTDLSPATSRRSALYRFTGTLIGAGGGAVMLSILPTSPLTIAAAILLAMLTTYLVHPENAAARVAGYVAAIVMLAHGDQPWLYAFNRAWETLIGIGSALVVGLVPLWLRERKNNP